MRIPRPAAIVLALFSVAAPAAHGQPRAIPIIFDTDFGMVPQDDSFALMLALHSPELEILGVTTVAGNFSVEQATADALRLLEIDGRTDIPVYRGANMPLVHEKSEYATTRHGQWWSDDPPKTPPGVSSAPPMRPSGRPSVPRRSRRAWARPSARRSRSEAHACGRCAGTDPGSRWRAIFHRRRPRRVTR